MDTAKPAPSADTDTPDASVAADGVVATPSRFAKWSPKPRIVQFIASRHFGLWSSVVAVILCSVLIGLGTWQVLRLHQKNNLISHITAQLRQPERDLRIRPPTDDAAWRALDYRRVVLQGDWLDLHQLKLIPRTYEGQNGYHLMIPLRLPNGQIVLVNRGWAPDKTDMGPQSQNGAAIAAGVIRMAPAEKPFGMMDNIPGKGQWAWPDLVAMANAIGVQTLAPVILYAERAPDAPAAAVNQADDYPIGGQVQLANRNEHKNYALTWYAMALSFLVIWMAAARRKTIAPPTNATAESADAAD